MQNQASKIIKLKIKDVVRYFVESRPDIPIIGEDNGIINVGAYSIVNDTEGYIVFKGKEKKHTFSKKSWALAYVVKSIKNKMNRPSGVLINRDLKLKRLEADKNLLENVLLRADSYKKNIIEDKLDRIYYEIDLINNTVSEDIKTAFMS